MGLGLYQDNEETLRYDRLIDCLLYNIVTEKIVYNIAKN